MGYSISPDGKELKGARLLEGGRSWWPGAQGALSWALGQTPPLARSGVCVCVCVCVRALQLWTLVPSAQPAGASEAVTITFTIIIQSSGVSFCLAVNTSKEL
eukprot:1159745-Pelagomonas_calceolata.AAC.6